MGRRFVLALGLAGLLVWAGVGCTSSGNGSGGTDTRAKLNELPKPGAPGGPAKPAGNAPGSQ